ncbi:MAG: bifunctional phosphopantothenoylcysteine decarboxylase/phosphopantothenate--cysteine ligase CoaBC, partial [Chloroflexi bacterium]|nr:bifunctional phosphopantothenoylcysteine decarboxylase/phosphopantothenate--cysteine ligase CoaBC [Chloroflexota bacterium]
HWLASMAHGLSGDVVTATCLATSAPVVVAPAMDGEMWTHPATVANAQRLRDDFGYRIVEPVSGPLASGQSGQGRLAELSEIVEAIVAVVGTTAVRVPGAEARPPLVRSARDADLEGRHIVVTAGGTREAIDPVRFIGNRSTGRMGAAIAAAALDRGARVTVVAANLEVALSPEANVVRVESTADLRAALLGLVKASDGSAGTGGFDALVMAAAVADFRPASPADRKLERSTGLTLALEPTTDILAEVAALVRGAVPRPFLVGFAAETGSFDRVAGKLERKGVDLLVANDVAEPGSGFGSETNRVSLLAADGSREDLPMLPKREVADRLLDRVARSLDDRSPERQTGRKQPEHTETR